MPHCSMAGRRSMMNAAIPILSEMISIVLRPIL
jgi:hypothetical protein